MGSKITTAAALLCGVIGALFWWMRSSGRYEMWRGILADGGGGGMEKKMRSPSLVVACGRERRR